MTLRRIVHGAITLALLLPVPAFALTFGAWDFTGANGWTNAGSSGGTLSFVPTAGSGASTHTFTTTVTPDNKETITANSSGWQNLTVSGGSVTVTFQVVGGNLNPTDGYFNPRFSGTSNQFTGTGPSGTINSGSVEFTGGSQRTLIVTISFPSGSFHSVPASPSAITTNFTN